LAKIIVIGGTKLKGRVKVSGAKNAVLPIIAGSLLTEGKIKLLDVPDLEDVRTVSEVIETLGAKTSFKNSTIDIETSNIIATEAPYELVKKMRASFLVMGPLLARTGRAKISLPGGCAIGSRPIDLHLKGFSALGAEIVMGHGYVEAVAQKLRGNRVYLDFPSVGATENIMMAAVLAEGTTIIENAAEEPEIVDLANFLNSMGAIIKGAGTDTIKITGVKELNGTDHIVIPDRIEAGTYMVAAAMTGGDVTVENVVFDHLKPVVAKLKEAGVAVEENGSSIRVVAPNGLNPIDIKTLPYPGFPTDMQAQMMAMLSVATGTSVIIETVFENRFMHVDELCRMGAKIRIAGKTAVVEGVKTLTGAPVKATDLRAGAALIMAGLMAYGQTEISQISHIDRGYEKVEEKFNSLGANLRRVE
jgi:UDP-N-acetylglucosamine 1-carboxyvinyltransferase